MKSEIFSFSKFKSVSVKNRDGDSLGDIHDVLLESQTGKIGCLLLATGGFLGMGEKYLPIPYEALNYDPKEDAFFIDIPKEKFQDAPQLDLGDHSTRADRSYMQDVYTFYGYKPGF